MRIRPLSLLLAALLVGPACDFFKELEDDKSEDDGKDESDDDSASDEDVPEVCEIGAVCEDQDTATFCEDDTVETIDCEELCGTYVNFTCLEATRGQPACWCVEPGQQKNASCPELEQCMRDCVGQDEACTDRCFARTNVATIRLYGALIHCAHASCTELCHETPGACDACIADAVSTGGSNCTLHRSVCDNDTTDEPWPGI